MARPYLSMSTADQCRAMGLHVGDTIEGREEWFGATSWRDGQPIRGARWHEVRLTLLWLGSEVAVFRETSRSDAWPEWSEPRERANWTLAFRDWKRVPLHVGGEHGS